MLKLNLELNRRQFTVDVNLTIPSHSLYCLYGPSAAGKSSILSVIAGFETSDRIYLEIDGNVMAAYPSHTTKTVLVPPWRRHIAYLAQNTLLFPHLTVAENVWYGVKSGISVPADSRWCDELVQRLEIEPYLLHKPRQLSGGLIQRVALARALAVKPSLLLLDEPFSALDWHARRTLQDLVREFQRRLGMTVVLVTHQLEEAQRMAQYMGVLDKGRLLQEGTPEELMRGPRSGRVAALLGYTGQAVVDGRCYALHPERAEVSRLTDEAIYQPAVGVAFTGTVQALYLQGGRSVAALRIDTGPGNAQDQEVVLGANQRFSVGQRVQVRFADAPEL